MNEEQNLADERFMRMALKEAEEAFGEGEIPVGAVVVSHGRIIARAHNQTEQLHDVTAHAEMLAITAAANQTGGKYLTDCTLYVTVEPCTMCAGAAGWAQISRIVYGAADGKRGFQLTAPHGYGYGRRIGRRVCGTDESLFQEPAVECGLFIPF